MSSSVPLVFSLKEQIAERIRNDVLCGRLLEGTRLHELKLVEQFGVSRTPIREALQQLTQEGLLETRPNAGVSVAKRPSDAIRELVTPIRRSVETFALKSYFAEITAEDFARWSEILERLRKACVAQDYTAIAEHDIEFHRSIVRRAHQPDIESIWNSLVSRVRSHFWETQRRNYSDSIEIYDEHASILEALLSGDLKRAVRALEDNIE